MAGDERDGELLEGGGQVGHRAAVAAGVLGDRDREDAQGGQVGEVGDRGCVVLGRVWFQAADGGERGGLFGPVADGRLQGLLLRRDRDRHGIIRTRFTYSRPGTARSSLVSLVN